VICLGHHGALLISAVLYVATAAVMTGMVPFPSLAWMPCGGLRSTPIHNSRARVFVKIGALSVWTSVVLDPCWVSLESCCDGGRRTSAAGDSPMPPTFQDPHVATVVSGVIFGW